MTKKRRRVIFYLLIAVFLLGGASAVLFAQGYRLSFAPLGIAKVGAIYIRTIPGDSMISLDERLVDRPFTIFEKGVLIGDLFPKTYVLEATREGFRPWKVRASVEPSMVVQFKNAVLVPETPTPVLPGPLENFWFIGGGIILTQNNSGTLMLRDEELPGDFVLGWNGNNTRLVTRESESKRHLWVDLVSGKAVDVNALLKRFAVDLGVSGSDVFPDPEHDDVAIVRSPRALGFFDFSNNRLTNIAPPPAANETFGVVAATPGTIAWATFNEETGESVLQFYNRTRNAIEEDERVFPNQTRKMDWTAGNLIGVLQHDGTLYLYDRDESGGPVAKANDVKDFSFSGDGSMLAALEHRSFEIFSLKGKDYWRFNLPDIERLSWVTWYSDKRHLFLHYPDRVLFLDLDDRSLENLITVAETTRGGYDDRGNTFYFIDTDGALKRLDFPRE